MVPLHEFGPMALEYIVSAAGIALLAVCLRRGPAAAIAA